MTEEMINEVFQEFKQLNKMNISLEDLKFALFEYGDELTKTVIHQELQNIVVKALKEDPKLNHGFDLETLQNTDFVYLKKYILLSRREELDKVKIVISGKKYDIGELRSTYYGKLILKDITSIGKRRMLTFDEYKEIREKFLTVNLDLPVEIKPTETEKLFLDIFGEENYE